MFGDFWVDVWYKGELIVSEEVFDVDTEDDATSLAFRLAKKVVPNPTQKFLIKIH